MSYGEESSREMMTEGMDFCGADTPFQDPLTDRSNHLIICAVSSISKKRNIYPTRNVSPIVSFAKIGSDDITSQNSPSPPKINFHKNPPNNSNNPEMFQL
ncbi:hypothetical protein CEXT_563931 [Caerostris extrusa]|uniref:Uncharacterized protein n=1 Tax=Caerostris extrusa TaxID=172846 RepID=A0AAV4VBV0_CAEEX|nr:hypothetical protein CEXT_563931 [Caerostris extrusa]